MKILIVDDDEVARLSLAAILRTLRAQIVHARDGQHAWELLEAGLRPVVCCSDILMPRMDGLELLRRVRGDRFIGDLPVVLISSASDRETVKTAISIGIAGYVVKPFKGVPTRTAIERTLRETLPLRSEPVQATRRRLKVTLDGLEQMLERLRAEARTVEESFAGDQPPEPRAALQRLQGGAQVLGIWKAARGLEHCLDDETPASDRTRAARELQLLVDEQLHALRMQAAG